MGRRAVALVLAALALALSGCWDQTAIEDVSYIVAMGVDKAEDEYLWTFRIVETGGLPVGMLSTSGSAEGLASGVITARAATLVQALQIVQAGSVRILSLSHMRNVVFGREVAEEGLEPILKQLFRHNEVRLSAGALVSRDRAVDSFHAFAPRGDTNAAKVQEGALLVRKRMHQSPPIRLKHFHSRLVAYGVDPILPLEAVNPLATQAPGSSLPSLAGWSATAGQLPRTGGDPVETIGTAIFRGDRMVGMLSVDETVALLALRGQMGKMYATVPDPLSKGHYVTLRYGQENKPKFTAALVNGQPVVHIKLHIDAELISTTGEAPYSFPEQRRKLEQSIARHWDATVQNPLVQKLYGEWGADPIGLGDLFRTRFPTYDAWLAFRWGDHIRQAKVTVESDLYIRRFGLTLDQPVGIKGGR